VSQATVAPSGTSATVKVVRKVAEAIFGIVIIVFILGPLVWLGVRAFSGSWVYPDLLPQTWTLRWWGEVFDTPGLTKSIWLSLSISPVVTLVSMLICLPAAYALSRYNFPGRQAVLVTIFATNAFPKFGLFITMASLFYSLNLMSTFLGVVIVQLIGTVVFMTWIPASAFASVPPSLEEAARDAGAGPLRIFFQITLPQVLPAILVAVILSFLAAFDEAQGTFLVGAPDYATMPIQMYSLIGNYPAQVSAVFSILLSIPSVFLLLLVRKHILGGAIAQGFQIK
jgi:putative spermidine/putrescine transport system permease protein